MHTYDLGKWFTENHNLNGVSAKLHITLIFLRESLGRTCIWFEEDPSRAVLSRSLYYVRRCFATSCQCYFASVTSLRALSLNCFDVSFARQILMHLSRVDLAQQSIYFGLRDLVFLGLCDLSRDYLSVVQWNFICLRQRAWRGRIDIKWLTSLLVTFIEHIPFVRFVHLPSTVFFWQLQYYIDIFLLFFSRKRPIHQARYTLATRLLGVVCFVYLV